MLEKYDSDQKRDLVKTLLEGNRRFLNKDPKFYVFNERDMLEFSKGQSPFAAIVSCSDSRVAPEIIFDQPLGKLFINRNAGNIVNSEVLASLELAVWKLSVRLIVVLGHTNCSAVVTSLSKDVLKMGFFSYISKLKNSILRGNIFFHKKKSNNSSDTGDYTTNIDDAIYYNILYGAERIKNSKYLCSMLTKKKIKIIGALYDVSTGEVSIVKYF